MPKYVFSQGTIQVETGVYRPRSNKDRAVNRSGVLLIITSTPLAADTKQTHSEDKEHPSDVPSNP